MYWEEKIDLVKKSFPDSDFSVPMTNRKNILRNFESEFVSKPKDYFELNNYMGPFRDWWSNYNGASLGSVRSDIPSLLERALNMDEDYWLGCEFKNGSVFIYKSKLSAMKSLISIASTYSRIFHISSLKFDYGISFKVSVDSIDVKAKGVDQKIIMDN